jgi:hypothetical protein
MTSRAPVMNLWCCPDTSWGEEAGLSHATAPPLSALNLLSHAHPRGRPSGPAWVAAHGDKAVHLVTRGTKVQARSQDPESSAREELIERDIETTELEVRGWGRASGVCRLLAQGEGDRANRAP